jgi:hypothetical protein
METMMRHAHMRRVALAALAVAFAACGKDEPKDPAARTVDDIFAELSSAGLQAKDVGPADGGALGGGECKAGAVKGIELTVCRYGDEKAAGAAQPAGLARVGEATGAALTHGPLLLVVADRAKADPDGKTINQITRVFRQKPALAAGKPTSPLTPLTAPAPGG